MPAPLRCIVGKIFVAGVDELRTLHEQTSRRRASHIPRPTWMGGHKNRVIQVKYHRHISWQQPDEVVPRVRHDLAVDEDPVYTATSHEIADSRRQAVCHA